MKERIIGAVVLVLFMVLVVPVFLDGPPGEDEIVTERVPLPGQADQETRTVVLDRDRETPVPAARADDAGDAGDATAPADAAAPPVTERPAPEPVLPPPVEPAPAQADVTERPARTVTAAGSVTGMWAVQLGSFGDKANAERLAADLRKQGFAAFLSQLTTDGGDLHRVRIGPQKDRQSAEAMAERLAAAGHKGQVVPHP
ncbi:MAG: SPOR domain-containing protein [Woeseiaceae bacterium]|nr:SPOR domain-containing protein [Woeseiaceae bacterium]